MIRDEKSFVDELQQIFEDNNFETHREVIPDECVEWEKPYRVDLIVYRDDIGFIAIEAKYLNTIGQGAIIAEAFEQINLYKGFTYFKGNMINRWCIAPRFDEQEGSERALIFIQTFLNYFSISLLTLKHYSSCPDTISIDKNTKKALRFYRGGTYE